MLVEYGIKTKYLKIWFLGMLKIRKNKILFNHKIHVELWLQKNPKWYRGFAYYCTYIISFSFRFEKSLPILFYIHYVHQGQMGKSKYIGCVRQGVQSASRRRIREYLLIYYIILFTISGVENLKFSKGFLV